MREKKGALPRSEGGPCTHATRRERGAGVHWGRDIVVRGDRAACPVPVGVARGCALLRRRRASA